MPLKTRNVFGRPVTLRFEYTLVPPRSFPQKPKIRKSQEKARAPNAISPQERHRRLSCFVLQLVCRGYRLFAKTRWLLRYLQQRELFIRPRATSVLGAANTTPSDDSFTFGPPSVARPWRRRRCKRHRQLRSARPLWWLRSSAREQGTFATDGCPLGVCCAGGLLRRRPASLTCT